MGQESDSQPAPSKGERSAEKRKQGSQQYADMKRQKFAHHSEDEELQPGPSRPADTLRGQQTARKSTGRKPSSLYPDPLNSRPVNKRSDTHETEVGQKSGRPSETFNEQHQFDVQTARKSTGFRRPKSPTTTAITSLDSPTTPSEIPETRPDHDPPSASDLKRTKQFALKSTGRRLPPRREELVVPDILKSEAEPIPSSSGPSTTLRNRVHQTARKSVGRGKSRLPSTTLPPPSSSPIPVSSDVESDETFVAPEVTRIKLEKKRKQAGGLLGNSPKLPPKLLPTRSEPRRLIVTDKGKGREMVIKRGSAAELLEEKKAFRESRSAMQRELDFRPLRLALPSVSASLTLPEASSLSPPTLGPKKAPLRPREALFETTSNCVKPAKTGDQQTIIDLTHSDEDQHDADNVADLLTARDFLMGLEGPGDTSSTESVSTKTRTPSGLKGGGGHPSVQSQSAQNSLPMQPSSVPTKSRRRARQRKGKSSVDSSESDSELNLGSQRRQNLHHVRSGSSGSSSKSSLLLFLDPLPSSGSTPAALATPATSPEIPSDSVVIGRKQMSHQHPEPPYKSSTELRVLLDGMIRGMSAEARAALSRPDIFEASILQNTAEDEPNAPPIYLENTVDDEPTPIWDFHYSNHMWHGEGVPPPTFEGITHCGCVGTCDPHNELCACVQKQQKESGGCLDGFAYDKRGRIKQMDVPIFECNDLCGCSSECMNRVVQHGRKVSVTISKTKDKGWGVFATKTIGKGAFIGVYAGEIIAEGEAHKRGLQYNKAGRTYLFDIDFLLAGGVFVVDAFHAGNFTRFLNHSHDPNCTLVACYINEGNIHKPYIAVFAKDVIKPGEELCFSYTGDNEEEDGEEEGPPSSPTQKDAIYAPCRCGAPNCTGQMFK